MRSQFGIEPALLVHSRQKDRLAAVSPKSDQGSPHLDCSYNQCVRVKTVVQVCVAACLIASFSFC